MDYPKPRPLARTDSVAADARHGFFLPGGEAPKRILRAEIPSGMEDPAACYPRSFSRYEADLVQRFMPLAAMAIQNSQRTVTLEAKMLEAEKKHAVANLLRGVSHDVNKVLGCVLPPVQQILVDVQSNRLQGDRSRIFSPSP